MEYLNYRYLRYQCYWLNLPEKPRHLALQVSCRYVFSMYLTRNRESLFMSDLKLGIGEALFFPMKLKRPLTHSLANLTWVLLALR
jgi:hypothetical protein